MRGAETIHSKNPARNPAGRDRPLRQAVAVALLPPRRRPLREFLQRGYFARRFSRPGLEACPVLGRDGHDAALGHGDLCRFQRLAPDEIAQVRMRLRRGCLQHDALLIAQTDAQDRGRHRTSENISCMTLSYKSQYPELASVPAYRRLSDVISPAASPSPVQ